MVRFRGPPSAGRTMEHEPSLSRQASAGRTSAVAYSLALSPHSPAGDELCLYRRRATSNRVKPASTLT